MGKTLPSRIQTLCEQKGTALRRSLWVDSCGDTGVAAEVEPLMGAQALSWGVGGGWRVDEVFALHAGVLQKI